MMEKVTAIHSIGGERFTVKPETFELIIREKSNATNAGWFYRFQTENNRWVLLDLSQAAAYEFASAPAGRPWDGQPQRAVDPAQMAPEQRYAYERAEEQQSYLALLGTGR